MTKIMSCLWFDDNADEAANFYASIFKGFRRGRTAYYTEAGFENHGRPTGSIMTIEFELLGHSFLAINGGPVFKFNEAHSIVIGCENQEEIDYYWSRLTANGGEEGPCGWLKDRFGLSWQVTPLALGDMLVDPDKIKVARLTDAYMQMKKFDLKALKAAFAK